MKLLLQVAAILICAGALASAGAQKGADVYKKNCAMCHGATGDANTPVGQKFKVPPFASEEVLKQSDESMLAIVKNGKDKMPAWKDKLSEGQIKDLVAFVHTLQKK